MKLGNLVKTKCFYEKIGKEIINISDSIGILTKDDGGCFIEIYLIKYQKYIKIPKESVEVINENLFAGKSTIRDYSF